jgi:hypothetical protein
MGPRHERDIRADEGEASEDVDFEKTEELGLALRRVSTREVRTPGIMAPLVLSKQQCGRFA